MPASTLDFLVLECYLLNWRCSGGVGVGGCGGWGCRFSPGEDWPLPVDIYFINRVESLTTNIQMQKLFSSWQLQCFKLLDIQLVCLYLLFKYGSLVNH